MARLLARRAQLAAARGVSGLKRRLRHHGNSRALRCSRRPEPSPWVRALRAPCPGTTGAASPGPGGRGSGAALPQWQPVSRAPPARSRSRAPPLPRWPRQLQPARRVTSWQQLPLAGRVCVSPALPPAPRRRCFGSGSKAEDRGQVTPLLKHLTFKIKSTGPITVAEYMREALTNPVEGYYMHHDMLGEKGDFITSPEISQIFGELIGIWYVSEWIATGKPKTLQLVELGPGRGTLTDDILRVFNQLGSLLSKCDISIHLVEVSPKLSEIQALTLTGENIQSELDIAAPVYMKGISKTGIPIFWYQQLQDVPQGTSFYLAHEFFDALPIHKFQRTEQGWREVLIDIDPKVPDQLRFVLAPSATPASEYFIQDQETRDHVEICPDAGIIIQRLTDRIQEDGGAALIADYGHNGNKTDTFRSFRNHKLHDVLIAPGTADLTADVDFSYLRTMTQGRVATLGPIKQQEFLKNMGIDVRLQVLLRNISDTAMREQLLQGYDMLMNPKKMGDRFNFFGLLPHQRLTHSDQKVSRQHSKSLSTPVAGFGELVWK